MPLEFEEAVKFRFYKLSRGEKERVMEALTMALAGRGEVALAILYGSFLKNISFRDVDVAVYVAGDVDPLDYKFQLEDELTKTLKLPVDVKILNHAPQWFLKKVIEDGRVLVAGTTMTAERLYLKALDEEYFLTHI